MDQIRHTCPESSRIMNPHLGINVSTLGWRCVDIWAKCCSSSCVSHLISVCVCLFLSVPRGVWPKAEKKSDLPFWWQNWPLPQQKWSVAWLRMVLLEFKICPSCCSYFLSHTRGREAILDSDTPMSLPMTIGQQGPALQADTMQIPLGHSQVHLMDLETNKCAPEDNSAGWWTSGWVWKIWKQSSASFSFHKLMVNL